MKRAARYCLILIAVPGTALAQIVTRETPMGAMREGEIVLVDDGTCPKGQIKRVVGDNHTRVGGTKQIIRTRSCVPR